MKQKKELVISLTEEEEVSRKILNIPNALSLLRIVLLPFFAWFYLNEKYGVAAGIAVVSGVSDCLDGRIARRFNMITKIGKILDPVSDKLTQCVMILCLATRYEYMLPVMIFFVLKEGFMGVMGALLLRRGQMLNGALWYGKVCTAVLYVVLILLVFFPSIPLGIANIMLLVCAVFMMISVIQYIILYWNIFRGEKQV